MIKKGKLLFSLGICSLALSPTFLISSKLDFDSEEDKDEKFVIFDYIKLTGKQKSFVIHQNEIVDGVYSKSRIYWFNEKGYSIFDYKNKKVCEVNPDVVYNPTFLNKTLRYDSLGQLDINYQTRDKHMPGDHKRNDKYFRDKMEKEWSSYYYSFTYQHFLNIKNAKQEEFEKYKINNMKNGLIYSQYEVPYSWWFKTSSDINYGWNSPENSFNKNESNEYHFYKKFPPYYKTEYYLQKSKGGICGYVAMTMLMLYNEYFKGSYYFNDYEKTFIEVNKNNISFDELKVKSSIEQCVTPALDSNFLKYLYQKTWFADGLNSFWNFKYISDSMLYNKWKDSKLNYSYWGGDWNTGQPWNTIVKYKTPTVLGGDYVTIKKNAGHAIVAYGAYDDGRFLCNYGWSDKYTQVIVRKPYGLDKINIAINHKWNNELYKYFNLNGTLYSGIEVDNLLKEKGYIK